eukprot:scaffold26751_cov147-Cylindrotheca_fusiformis.AAC.2
MKKKHSTNTKQGLGRTQYNFVVFGCGCSVAVDAQIRENVERAGKDRKFDPTIFLAASFEFSGKILQRKKIYVVADTYTHKYYLNELVVLSYSNQNSRAPHHCKSVNVLALTRQRPYSSFLTHPVQKISNIGTHGHKTCLNVQNTEDHNSK